MTIDEAKYAVKSKATVLYKGATWRANGIISWYEKKGSHQGWRNSIDLIPLNGARSYTQALVRDCELKEPA